MKENSFFNRLDLMMLSSTEHTLVFEDEFMLTGNFNLSTDPEAVSRFISASYPFKIMFTMVMFCTQGRMRGRLNLVEYNLGANDVMIVLPGSIGECLEFSNDCRLAIMLYSGNKYSDEFNSTFSVMFRKYLVKQFLIHLSDEELEESLTIYNLMRKKIQQPDYEFTREALMGFMQVLACNAYQWISTRDKIQQMDSVENRQQKLFESFLELVQKHYLEQRNIKFYADLMCLTPKYLSQVIHHTSGRYAGEWIKDYVVLEAKALLKSGKYTVQQVSDWLNFANASFFGKYFKAAVGSSPRKYMIE